MELNRRRWRSEREAALISPCTYPVGPVDANQLRQLGVRICVGNLSPTLQRNCRYNEGRRNPQTSDEIGGR